MAHKLSVAYYGYVFEASGYGHAARAYIRAMHDAGITLSVAELGENPPQQVRDEFVRSLIGRRIDADFRICHGVPPDWAHLAASLPNVIGMTVSETDRMPPQWKDILNHGVEVWLPCEFNVVAFREKLERPVFKLPQPYFPLKVTGTPLPVENFLGVSDDDYVFFDVFHWQNRKNPIGLIESYLRAFTDCGDTVLIIKTHMGAAGVARRVIESVRRRVCSDARIEVHAKLWDDDHLDALYQRGNCYVSLHRGEGWCYPLFEAACRGIPLIATGYSGPMEYLNPLHHQLVGYELGPVRQRYPYYSAQMRWAEPDLDHAVELMRRVYEHRQYSQEQALVESESICQTFSLGRLGTMIQGRLLTLLRTSSESVMRRQQEYGCVD